MILTGVARDSAEATPDLEVQGETLQTEGPAARVLSKALDQEVRLRGWRFDAGGEQSARVHVEWVQARVIRSVRLTLPRQGVRLAAEQFEAAVAIDPGYSAAHERLAIVREALQH